MEGVTVHLKPPSFPKDCLYCDKLSTKVAMALNGVITLRSCETRECLERAMREAGECAQEPFFRDLLPMPRYMQQTFGALRELREGDPDERSKN